MTRKGRTRFLSALLTLAMLISLMPAAFAASSDIDLSVDLGDKVYLSFTNVRRLSRYEDIAYFTVYDYNNGDGPKMYDGNSRYTYSSSSRDYLDFTYFNYFNFYADSSTVDDDETYHYDIDFYDEDFDRIDTVDVYVTVGKSNSYSSTDGDIYAEIDKYGYVELYDYEDDLYDYAADEVDGTPDYIYFTYWDNGKLYYSDGDTVNKKKYFYLDNKYQNSDLEYYGIYFEVEDESEEAYIEFTIYDETGDYVKGTIIVNGDGSSAGDIEYSTDYNTEVYFEGSDFEDLLSSSQTLEYVTFTLPSSSKGTLYWDNYKLDSDDELDSDDLDEVSFVPKSGVTGNVSISFRLYYTTRSSSRPTYKSGTVVISIADGATISYTGEVGEEVAFDSDDFDDVCYEATGRSLDYVKFTLPSSSKGTLYAEYDGTSKGSTAAKSTTKFYVDPDDGEYTLDDVVFVPAASGTVELTYTAYYSSSSSSSSSKSFTGKVKITTTAGTLRAISYTVKNGSADFSASDFTAALKAKTTKTLFSVTFTLPKSTEGTLYYNDSTKVTASTQYKASGSTNSLDKVSFVPASGTSGSVTIAYTAKDSSGNSYNGTVVVQTFVGQDTVLTYSTTGRAVTFSVSDFTNACAKKLNTSLSYVQFILPSEAQGHLYYGYGTTQQAAVSATAKYTVSTHLPYVSFLPKAGYSGTVTLVYTGYDTAGESYTGYIQILVAPPSRSTYFTDANASWIAPAADFLQSYNVYSGVVSGSTLGLGTQVTRGEVMQMIYNAFNLKNQVSSVSSNFTDVPANHSYYTAINAGYMLGITNGDGTGKFNPDLPITRQDACTLLYRAFTKLGLNMSTGTANDLKTFGDYATVSDYAVSGVANMIKSGIIQGDDNNNISPKSNLNRGEISVILYRAMTL